MGKVKKVLVINYHNIDTGNEIKSSGIDLLFSVRKSYFENQIKILIKKNIPIVSLEDIINNNISSSFSVALTIDDGNATDYEIIYPLFKIYNIKATFFWLVGDRSNKFSQDHALDMINNGFLIASHGIMHRDLTKLNLSDQKYELEFSKYFIEEKLHQSVNFFSLPFGMYNRKIIGLAIKAGYKAVMTTEVKLNYPGKRPFLIHRWSVKRSTTLKEFEGMVTNKSILKRKCITSKFIKAGKGLLGKSISDKINILFHSGELAVNKQCKGK